MKTIILNSGIATRMMPLTKDKPKCLLRVNGVTILNHQLNNLQRAGIHKAAIVIGYRHKQIEKAVASYKLKGLKTTFIYNPFDDISNNIVSCWLARPEMNEDFILINGDNIFDWRILKLLKEASGGEIILSINKKDNYDQDDMKVTIEQGKVIAVNKQINDNKISGESIGIMKFLREGVNHFREGLDSFIKDNGKENLAVWYLSVVELLSKKYKKTIPLDISSYFWEEIDFPKDLKEVRKKMKRGLKL